MKCLARCLVILLGLICFSVIADEGKVITIVSDPWCPFSCGKDSKKEGLVIEVVRAAFEPLGYQVKYEIFSWLRCLDMLKNGQVNMISTVDQTIDKSDYIAGTQPVTTTNFGFFIKSDSKFAYNANDINSMKGTVVGINGGEDVKGAFSGAFGQYVDQNINNHKIIQKVSGNDSHNQLIRMLNEGRVDIIVDTSKVLEYYINLMNFQDKIKMGGVVSVTMDEYIGFAPNLPESKELMKIFDERIIELKKSGAYDKIIKSYGLIE